jgi:hypothetical protein
MHSATSLSAYRRGPALPDRGSLLFWRTEASPLPDETLVEVDVACAEGVHKQHLADAGG